MNFNDSSSQVTTSTTVVNACFSRSRSRRWSGLSFEGEYLL